MAIYSCGCLYSLFATTHLFLNGPYPTNHLFNHPNPARPALPIQANASLVDWASTLGTKISPINFGLPPTYPSYLISSTHLKSRINNTTTSELRVVAATLG